MIVLIRLPDQRQLVAPGLYTTSADALDAFFKRWLAPSLALRRSAAIRQRVQAATGAAATQPQHHQSVRLESQGTRLDMPEQTDAGADQQRDRDPYEWHMAQPGQDKRYTRQYQEYSQQDLTQAVR